MPYPSTIEPSRPTRISRTVSSGRARPDRDRYGQHGDLDREGAEFGGPDRGNRGSSVAAETAASRIAFWSGRTGSGNPMQPRRLPLGW